MRAAVGAKEVRARFETVTLPETLQVRSTAAVETRHRGIHKAQVFRSTHHLTAIFHVPAHLGFQHAGRIAEAAPARWVVEAEIELVGTSRLSLVPIGGVTRFELDGNWPHPSFDGSFLPDERRVEDKGFHAEWALSRFATGVDGAIAQWRSGSKDSPPAAMDIGVTFLEPVDVYQLSERATKYGMLFVLLTYYLVHILGARARVLGFGVLAAVMIVTRCVDWNRVGEVPKG